MTSTNLLFVLTIYLTSQFLNEDMEFDFADLTAVGNLFQI